VTDFTVRRARHFDREQLIEMMQLLWPATDVVDLRHDIDSIIGTRSAGALGAAILVADAGGGELHGFLEVGLRSHADGCDPSRAVGYVEGWFVREAVQRRGIGRALMRAAEEWARAHGCVEMASDALIDNALSETAHIALGFEVVDRCVHFRRALRERESRGPESRK
jgi:aminoglycoside 6'-N-acetyltransferase I